MPKRSDRSKSHKSAATAVPRPSAPPTPPRTHDLDAVLLECNAALAGMIEDFVTGAQADLALLKTAGEALAASKGAPEDIEAVHRVAHNLMGLGGSIGFPLLTTVGNGLCELLAGTPAGDAQVLDLIDRHIAAMDLILTKPILGDGGLEGAALLDTLRTGLPSLSPV